MKATHFMMLAIMTILMTAVSVMADTTPTASVTNTTATIAWTSTLNGTNASINYGTTTALGTYANNSDLNTTSHTITLTGLTAYTTYYYNVSYQNSTNLSEVITAGTYSFTTEITPLYQCTASELAVMGLILIVYFGSLAFFIYNIFQGNLTYLLPTLLFVIFAVIVGSSVIGNVVHTACIP